MAALLAGVLVLALPCAAMAQIAVLQIKVLEGEGAVHPAGARAARPLTVSVTDETGRPVEGASVSFRLPEEGPGGTFAGGMRTDLAVTDGRGRASMRGLAVNRTPGQFEIRISVVKEQVRAGMVAFQYVSDARPSGGAVRAGGTRRWKTVLLLAAGAAAGGVAAAKLGGGASTGAAAPPVNVGAPSISVGKP